MVTVTFLIPVLMVFLQNRPVQVNLKEKYEIEEKVLHFYSQYCIYGQ